MNHLGQSCPFCQTPFKPQATVVACSRCGMPHHADCWRENGGCSTYGCTETVAAPMGQAPQTWSPNLPPASTPAAPSTDNQHVWLTSKSGDIAIGIIIGLCYFMMTRFMIRIETLAPMIMLAVASYAFRTIHLRLLMRSVFITWLVLFIVYFLISLLMFF